MSPIRPILLAVMTVAFATYAFDCLAMSTPDAAMQCCDTMHCSSHGHQRSQECCKTMPAVHRRVSGGHESQNSRISAGVPSETRMYLSISGIDGAT